MYPFLYRMLEQDRGNDLEITSKRNPDKITGGDQYAKGRKSFKKTKIKFALFKVATTPMFKHFDPYRLPVIVVYASQLEVSAALIQER